jgi:asparaginyl-tRNA synthetase
VILHVLEHCDEDLAFFEKNISKDNLRERLRKVATEEFARITYTEAVEHVLARAGGWGWMCMPNLSGLYLG